MTYGNLVVVLLVILVVASVLGMAFAATYCLNKAVDQSDR